MTRSPADTVLALYVGENPERTVAYADALEAAHDRLSVEAVPAPGDALARLDDVDCVVSEFDVPGGDGIEFLERVRETAPDLPFVLRADDGSERVASDAIAAGVTDYLPTDGEDGTVDTLATRVVDRADGYRSPGPGGRDDPPETHVLRAVSDVVWERCLETGTVRLADGLAATTGFDADRGELSFEWWLERVHPDDRERVHTRLDSLLDAGRNTYSAEYRFRHADGSYLAVEDDGYVTYDDRGEPRRLLRSVRDVTARTEGRRERDQYRDVVETVAAGVFVLDARGEIDLVNREMTRLTGYDRDELLGAPVSRIVAEDDLEAALALHERVTEDEHGSLEWHLETAAGERRSVESRVAELAEHGDGSVWTVADTSARASRERELQQQRNRLEQYETILETLPVGVAALDDSATVEWVNEAFWTAFDKSEAEVTGMPFIDLIEEGLIEPEIGGKYFDGVRRLLSSKTDDDRVTVEFEVDPPHEDGRREYEGYIALQPLDDGAFDGTVNAFLDVTERKRRERELEQYRAAMETVPDGVFLLDEDGTMLRVNEAWASIVGYDSAELVGEPFLKLVDEGVIEERVIESYLGVIPSLLSSETERDRAKFTTRVTPPGSANEHVYEVHIGLLPFDDEFRGAAGVIRDVTEKVKRQEQLERENQRLEEFASIVSHDLRNPLTVAKGFTERAHETGEVEVLDRAITALDRMETITGDVLELSRQGKTITETEPILLRRLVENCWKTVETRDAELQFDGPEDVSITADGDRLQQLLENLVRNAVEHGGDDVTVRIGAMEAGFYVEDDGPGIPEDDRDEVFEAGHSSSSDGTGFGLNIVEQIVDAHGWQIAVTAGSDGGARFEITGVEVDG